MIWEIVTRSKRDAALLGTLQNICRTPGMASCLTETIFAQDE